MAPSFLSAAISGMANFSIQYNFQCISVVLLIMSAGVCTTDDDDCRQGIQASWVTGSVTAVVFVGAILGQISMGYLGDLLGRNNALMIALIIATLAAMLSAVAPYGTPKSIYATIIVFRFFLGTGLGALFPLTATKSSEDNSGEGKKPNMLAAAKSFFWQMPGIVAPWLLAYILTFNSSMGNGAKWRLILGVGSIFPAVALFGLLVDNYINPKTEEPPPTKSSIMTLSSIESEKISVRSAFNDREVVGSLLIAGGSWFLYDIIAYGVALFGGEILSDIVNTDDDISTMHNIRLLSQSQLVAVVVGIPSTIIAISVFPLLGLRRLQSLSFALMSILALLISSLFFTLKRTNPNALFALYCLLNAAIQGGANITTYSLPPRLFKKEIRATFNGFASAMGKCGAVVGSYLFQLIGEDVNYAVVLGICCVLCAIAGFVSFFFLDDKKLDDDKSDSLLSSSDLQMSMISKPSDF